LAYDAMRHCLKLAFRLPESGSSDLARRRRRWKWWVGGGAVTVAVLAVAGPYVYIHFIEGPAPSKLSLSGSSGSSSGGNGSTGSSGSSVTGAWKVGSGSTVGYRVQEVLIGQNSTAVGRTTKVSGTIEISGKELSSAKFTADLASVKSDQSQRNSQFDGRIMDVSTYPTATFTLTSPVDFGSVPAIGAIGHANATGNLTMHGATKAVTFPVSYERTSTGIDILADVKIVFSRWNIANPSIGGFVTTSSDGTLEVLLHLTRGPGNPAVTGSSSGSSGSGAPGGGAPITVPSTTVPKLSIPKGS
jgi:polyisoprenoid-binding protein YceI